ncbi:MAG: Rieske 2Fe-2S domain-containing protein [Pseudomonadota bacterium]
MSLDVTALIQPGKVHRRVYTCADIFDAEQERLFRKSWLYVGHDSQIPEAGDVVTTRLANEPVIAIRQRGGDIQLFYNRCKHKGMQLLADGASGNVPALRCGYHGWIYGLDGALKTIPAATGYDDSALRPGCAEGALTPVGALETYRGFLFARLESGGPDFADWLAPMRASLDNMIDRAPAGRLSVAGGVLRYEHKCNWKFFFENTLDALHPMVVHNSSSKAAQRAGKTSDPVDSDEARALNMLAPFSASYSFFDDMGQRAGAFGHGELGGKSSIHAGYDVDPAYWEAMVAAYGEERTKEILGFGPNNSVLYPTIMFKAPVAMLRVIRPIAVDRTMIETWHFRMEGAPDTLLEQTLQYSTIVNSSAGIVGPDDHEAYIRLQAGLKSQGSDWVILSRYAGQVEKDGNGLQIAPGTSDFVFRNQYAAWADAMAQT